MEESTGVTLSWERNGVYTRAAFSDGQMIGKAIEVNDPRVMALLTPVTDFDALHTIERDMNYTQIVEIMGCEGLEIMARINREESPITVSAAHVLDRFVRQHNADTVQPGRHHKR